MYSIARRLAHLAVDDTDSDLLHEQFSCTQDDIAAVQLFQRCIDEQNHYGAMYDLAVILSAPVQKWKHVQRNLSLAVSLLCRCGVEANNFDAMKRLASILVEGASGVGPNVPHAIRLYQDCIDATNDCDTMIALVRIMLNRSLAVERDMPYVIQLCKTFAACSPSCYLLRDIAEKVERHSDLVYDVSLAVKLYQICIDANDAKSIFCLGKLFAIGKGNVERDQQRALQLLEQCCHNTYDTEYFSASPMRRLAICFASGEKHLRKDVPFAVQLFQLCIERYDDHASMASLARILAKGGPAVEKATARTLQLCINYLEKSGELWSTLHLVRALVQIPGHAASTVQLYETNLERDNAPASMIGLAMILLTGAPGVERDVARALQLCISYIELTGYVCVVKRIAHVLITEPENAPFAVQLYEMCIEKGSDDESMISLVKIFATGVSGIEKDAARALQLSINCLDLGIGVDSVRCVASNLIATGLRADALLGIAMYQECFNRRKDFDALFSLIEQFVTGGNGVEKDIMHAIQLSETYIEHFQHLDVDDLFPIAELFERGGVDSDVSMEYAMQLYETWIDKFNDLISMQRLVAILISDRADRRDVQRILKLCQKMIERFDSCRFLEMIARRLFAGGSGMKQDVLLAVQLFKMGINRENDGRCMLGLAEMYVFGAEGFERDEMRAMKLCRKSLDMDNMGCVDLRIFAQTLARRKRVLFAMQLYEIMIENYDDYDAAYDMMELLATGAPGVERDVERAIRLSQRLMSEEGDCQAAKSLASMFAGGLSGAVRDVPLAVRLYEVCVEEWNNYGAMFDLAEILSVGAPGVEKNVERAVQLYKRCADEGLDAEAERRLVEIAALVQD